MTNPVILTKEGRRIDHHRRKQAPRDCFRTERVFICLMSPRLFPFPPGINFAEHYRRAVVFFICSAGKVTLKVTVQFACNGWLLSAPCRVVDFYFACQCCYEFTRTAVISSASAGINLRSFIWRCQLRVYQGNYPTLPFIPIKGLVIYIFNFASFCS